MASWCRGSVLVLIAAVGIVAGCQKQTVQLDRQGFEQKVAARMEAAMAQPAVDQALEAFMEALASDPVLQQAGGSLFETLTADPKIAAATEQLMESIQTLPAMEEAVRSLMARNPDASQDEIGELVGTRASNALDSPQVSAVFDSFGEAIMKSKEPALLTSLTNAFGARLEHAISREDEARWSKRLIELNGGSVPPPPRATDLYLEHAWNARRLEKLTLALLANPTVRGETAKLLVVASSVDEVALQLRRSVSALVQDPAIRAQALEVFSRCLAEPRDDEAVAAALRTVLLSKPVLDAVANVIGAAINNPEVSRRAGAMLDAIRADRGVRASFDEFMNRW